MIWSITISLTYDQTFSSFPTYDQIFSSVPQLSEILKYYRFF